VLGTVYVLKLTVTFFLFRRLKHSLQRKKARVKP
jgi:hypothetical protein